MNRLTVNEIEGLLSTVQGSEQEYIQSHAVQLATQLLDTMRELAALKNVISQSVICTEFVESVLSSKESV